MPIEIERPSRISSTNPATGKVLHDYRLLTEEELEMRLALSAEAFRRHRQTSFAYRAERMAKAAQVLESRVEEFAQLMTQEMGKTLESARSEALKCASACRYYSENAERFLADEYVDTNATRSYIAYQPLGPVLAVMPWNFPFWQVFRFAVPALMAGNVGLLKHASNVPGCALAIESIFREAGFDEGVFQTLLIGVDTVQKIIDDDRVVAATLTGSEYAGSQVAQRAGKRIKKTVLELGGSDPFIVMPSANMEDAVRTAVKARVINNGQSCIAAKRFIVAESIADEFRKRFVAGMQSLKVGDPLQPDTDVGPLATPSILADLERQVKQFVDAGARVLTGGEKLDRPGNFFAPTVITDIAPGTPVYYEELFGPVAMLFVVHDADHAIRLANDSPFGLGASVWTNDHEERDKFIAGVESGMVFVNGMVASDPRLPFGGVKHSGYGRELGVYGIREFVNLKTVWIKDEMTRESLPETE
jgi:succinate-semialdehyde dehydrogenase/glutarate-semialdehyde dehydrogenase